VGTALTLKDKADLERLVRSSQASIASRVASINFVGGGRLSNSRIARELDMFAPDLDRMAQKL
jgi:hypothetical protein